MKNTKLQTLLGNTCLAVLLSTSLSLPVSAMERKESDDSHVAPATRPFVISRLQQVAFSSDSDSDAELDLDKVEKAFSNVNDKRIRIKKADSLLAEAKKQKTKAESTDAQRAQSLQKTRREKILVHKEMRLVTESLEHREKELDDLKKHYLWDVVKRFPLDNEAPNGLIESANGLLERNALDIRGNAQLLGAVCSAKLSDFPSTLEKIGGWRSLQTLTLKACNLSPDDDRAIGNSLRQLPHLQRVEFVGIGGIGDGLIQALRGNDLLPELIMPHLTYLSLRGSPVGGEGCGAFLTQVFRAAPHLQVVDLRATVIGDPGVQALQGSLEAGKGAHLQKLHLAHNVISDGEAAGLIVTLARTRGDTLQHLSLEGNSIGEETIEQLTAAVNQNLFSVLIRLELSDPAEESTEGSSPRNPQLPRMGALRAALRFKFHEDPPHVWNRKLQAAPQGAAAGAGIERAAAGGQP